MHTLRGDHRVQRAQPRKGDALLRTGPFIKAQAKGPLTEKAYLDALEKDHRLTRKEGIDAVMEKFQLDALVAPTGGPAWLTDLVDGDHDVGGSSTTAGGGGLSEHHSPGGLHLRPAGRNFILRQSLQRADFDKARLFLRAGHPASPCSAVSPHRGFDQVARALLPVLISKDTDPRAKSACATWARGEDWRRNSNNSHLGRQFRQPRLSRGPVISAGTAPLPAKSKCVRSASRTTWRPREET